MRKSHSSVRGRDPWKRIRRFGRLASLIALVFGLAIASAAQTPTGSISGEVVDPHGTPLPGARVSVTNISTGATLNVATDAGGRFAVEQLAQGDYRVVVASTGFVTKDLKLTLKPGGKAKEHIRLKVPK
jgi:hypothetical protein